MAEEQFEEERENIYIIPQNFANGTKIFRGMFQVRNVIEAAILCVPLGFFEYNLLANTETGVKICVMVITIGPLAVFSIIGINGDSMSQFIMSVLQFMKNKRVMRFQRIKKYSDTNKSKIKTMPKNKR